MNLRWHIILLSQVLFLASCGSDNSTNPTTAQGVTLHWQYGDTVVVNTDHGTPSQFSNCLEVHSNYRVNLLVTANVPGGIVKARLSSDGEYWTQASDADSIVLPFHHWEGFLLCDTALRRENLTVSAQVTAGDGNIWTSQTVNIVANYSDTSLIVITRPDAPALLSLVTVTESTAILTWNDNSDNEDGFIVYFWSDSLVHVDTTAANQRSDTLTDLAPDVTYQCVVRAFNVADTSEPSNQIQFHTTMLHLGRISGVARVVGTWPDNGLLVMLTTYPVAGWIPSGVIAPLGYFPMATPADTMFRFNVPFNQAYYLSIWTNSAPPDSLFWYGSYGVNTAYEASDATPDSVRITDSSPAADNLVVSGVTPAPHFLSGNITFNGDRPVEGLLVLISSFPWSPEHHPTGAPSGYFQIFDRNATLYAFSGIPTGVYYVSLWNNIPPPTEPTFYGAYGYTSGSDLDPDPVMITQTFEGWGASGVNIPGHP